MTLATRLATLLAATTLAGVCGATEPPPPPADRPAPVTACVFSRDGTSLLVARENEVLVMSTRDGTVARVLKPALQKVTSLAWCRNGEILAVAGGVPGVSGAVVLLDWTTGRALDSGGGFGDLATSVSLSPDGKTLAAASADRTVRLFAFPEGTERLKPIARLEGHAGAVLSVLFGRDGATVVSGSADRSVKVWDPSGGRLLRTLSNHTGAVHCLGLRPTLPDVGGSSPDSCASGGDDHTLRIWQPRIGRMVRIVRKHEGPIFCVAYCPNGSALYSAGAEGIVRMIDADSDTIVKQWRASDDWIYSLAVSPDGTQVATGDWTGEVKLWQVSNQAVRLTVRPPLAKGR